MNNKSIPKPELLRKILRYDPETGDLFWRKRPVSMFTDGKQTAEHNCSRWNSRNAGKAAFTAHDAGYPIGAIFGCLYKAHRVIWAMASGAWPAEEIDHISGVRNDNRIVNLRAVSHSENMRNHKLRSTNTSGTTGVWWDKSRCNWNAQIGVNSKKRNLGSFDTKTEATAMRKAAEIELGYHRNHGRITQ